MGRGRGHDVVRDELGGRSRWDRELSDARADAESDRAGELAAAARRELAGAVIARALHTRGASWDDADGGAVFIIAALQRTGVL